jgi:hypothetical protein
MSQSNKSVSQGHWHHGCYYPLKALPSDRRRGGGNRSSVLAVSQTASTEYRDPPPASEERSRTTPGPEPGGVDACRSIVGAGPCHVDARWGATTWSEPARAAPPGSEIESQRQPDSCPEGDFGASSNGLEV